MDEKGNAVLDWVIITLVIIILFLLASIILMIPVVNVFIAHAMFGGD